jgi:hypothetical protein
MRIPLLTAPNSNMLIRWSLGVVVASASIESHKIALGLVKEAFRNFLCEMMLPSHSFFHNFWKEK